jgi:DNA-binding response OmpR family regulator
MGGSIVLIVEDDPSLRLLCRVNLELERYTVLVLLDLHVGEQHGLELLPYLRESRPDAPVCLLSGTSETDPGRPEGVHAFIRKPFELDDLIGTVQRLLTQEPARP